MLIYTSLNYYKPDIELVKLNTFYTINILKVKKQRYLISEYATPSVGYTVNRQNLIKVGKTS